MVTDHVLKQLLGDEVVLSSCLLPCCDWTGGVCRSGGQVVSSGKTRTLDTGVGLNLRGTGPWKVEGFSLMSLFLSSLTPTPEAPGDRREPIDCLRFWKQSPSPESVISVSETQTKKLSFDSWFIQQLIITILHRRLLVSHR